MVSIKFVMGEGLKKSILKPCSYEQKSRLSVTEVTNIGYPRKRNHYARFHASAEK